MKEKIIYGKESKPKQYFSISYFQSLACRSRLIVKVDKMGQPIQNSATTTLGPIVTSCPMPD